MQVMHVATLVQKGAGDCFCSWGAMLFEILLECVGLFCVWSGGAGWHFLHNDKARDVE